MGNSGLVRDVSFQGQLMTVNVLDFTCRCKCGCDVRHSEWNLRSPQVICPCTVPRAGWKKYTLCHKCESYLPEGAVDLNCAAENQQEKEESRKYMFIDEEATEEPQVVLANARL